MSKPLIGVVPLWNNHKPSVWMLPGYMDGIVQAGGLPMILPLTMDKLLLEQICQTVDGLVFTGGPDVYPGLYGEEVLPVCDEISSVRDFMEDFLFDVAVVTMDKPALGICRGIQFFNVFLGGSLYQDLPSQYNNGRQISHDQSYTLPAHSLAIEPGCPLFDLLKIDTMSVNSIHHQGIKKLSKDLTCMARAEDGLIEAVFMPGKKFVWGVQWHPECILHNENNRRLFEAFVSAC